MRAAYDLCQKQNNPRFSSCLRAKVEHQGPPGSARAQPRNLNYPRSIFSSKRLAITTCCIFSKLSHTFCFSHWSTSLELVKGFLQQRCFTDHEIAKARTMPRGTLPFLVV